MPGMEPAGPLSFAAVCARFAHAAQDVEQVLPGESLALDLDALTYVRYRYYVPSPSATSPSDESLSETIPIQCDVSFERLMCRWVCYRPVGWEAR